uniref:Proteasome alpha-type subunits domain-containing protein n=1 Tax=Chaetoceros debilis TaxID=122233 RepID=A0A7S3QEI4_9STRA
MVPFNNFTHRRGQRGATLTFYRLRATRVAFMSSLAPVLFLLLLTTSSTCASSRNSKSSSLYPMSKLESSLTASSGQATVIAVRSPLDNSVVILSMTPRDQSCNLTISHDNVDDNISRGMEMEMEMEGEEHHTSNDDVDDESSVSNTDLIPILDRGAIRIPFVVAEKREDKITTRASSTITSRIMHLLQEQSGLSLFMTGFASDVQYLVRYAAGHVAEHEHLYAGDAPTAPTLVRDALAPCLRDATMSGGSRPFGVQGLVVGPARPRRNLNVVDESGALVGVGGPCDPPLQIITMDPSGNYRYWQKGGVVIGKDAALGKKHLFHALATMKKKEEASSSSSLTSSSSPYEPECWSDSLDVAIRALLETVEESQNMRETPSEEILTELDAVVIFGPSSKSRQMQRRHNCVAVSRSAISVSFSKCLEAMNGKKLKAKSI